MGKTTVLPFGERLTHKKEEKTFSDGSWKTA